MSSEEIKSELIGGIKKDIIRSPVGGQVCGVMPVDVTLSHEELGIKISVGYYKSQHKNYELAMTLFKLAIDDLVK